MGDGAQVTGGRRMTGGITSSVHRLSIRLPGGTSTQVVLKRFADPRWDDRSGIVRTEAAALVAVDAPTVPAPRLIAACPSGIDTDGAPSLLMSRAPGRVWLTPPDLDAWTGQMAALLPPLHELDSPLPAYEPRDHTGRTAPAGARRTDLWAAGRRLVTSGRPPGGTAFVHGDYQHFNVLWSRGRLSSLVDWSLARTGHPDVDVGHCRLNLAVLYSVDVAERFRRAYEAEAGRPVEPWWDVHQLLAYDHNWPAFIPVQVAGRAPVDVAGMTSRVEELLGLALARA
jgi:hypothetical protein